jgi:hypothetical protein
VCRGRCTVCSKLMGWTAPASPPCDVPEGLPSDHGCAGSHPPCSEAVLVHSAGPGLVGRLSLSGPDRPMPHKHSVERRHTSRRCRLRCGTGRPTRRRAPTGQPHLVDRARTAEMLTDHWTQRAGSVCGCGHSDQPDAARGGQAAVASDRGPDEVGAVVDGFDDFNAGSHRGQPSCGDLAGHPGDASPAGFVTSTDRHPRSASQRSRSVAGGDVWYEVAPEMAKAASGG